MCSVVGTVNVYFYSDIFSFISSSSKKEFPESHSWKEGWTFSKGCARSEQPSQNSKAGKTLCKGSQAKALGQLKAKLKGEKKWIFPIKPKPQSLRKTLKAMINMTTGQLSLKTWIPIRIIKFVLKMINRATTDLKMFLDPTTLQLFKQWLLHREKNPFK